MHAASTLTAIKMHGAENTFVLIDERPPQLAAYAALARDVCAEAGGFAGADGLLVVRAASGYAAEMLIFNADGSEAEMCGNGVRCVVRYLAERGAGDAFEIKTRAGRISAEIVARTPHFAARVDIGPVRFGRDGAAQTLDALGRSWTFYAVSLGNPHAVVFVDDPDEVDLVALGRAFNDAACFPEGTNLHLARVIDARTLAVRHYERGVGLTRACGTGAVACAAAARHVHGTETPTIVHVPGGTLVVEWRPGAPALLTGPAETLSQHTIAL